jgi:hypothetical protein
MYSTISLFRPCIPAIFNLVYTNTFEVVSDNILTGCVKIEKYCLRLEVFTAMIKENAVFWGVRLCSCRRS